MNETKSKSPLFSHKSRDYTTVSSTHLFIQSLIIKKIGCSKARLLSQLLLNSLINTLFHLFSACTKRNVDFMLSYDKWLPALTPHRHKSDVSVCFYPTARKWMSVFFKMSNWYSESNGKKKTLLQLGMLTRAICLSGQSPACCNSEWIYHLHVNRAAEVVGFLPAAWSLTIWQLSRSKMQPMFGININRQKCPPPTSRFQLESQSFLVKWNQSFHISVHLMFTFIQL